MIETRSPSAAVGGWKRLLGGKEVKFELMVKKEGMKTQLERTWEESSGLVKELFE